MERTWRSPDARPLAPRATGVDTWPVISRWDGWTLDVPGRQLSGPAGPVHVEPQVFDVLAYLVRHRERVVPKEELLDEIWGDQFVSESALTSRIKSARRSIGDDGRSQRYIRNVHGRGYQFIGELDGRGRPSASSTAAAPSTVDLPLAIGLDAEFPFVGRAQEIAAARAVVEGPGLSMVLIGGEPGIGKSRLAVEILAAAQRRDSMVCAARCEEFVSAPLQPIRDAVGQLADANPSELSNWAAGFERQIVSLVPSLSLHLDVDPQPVDTYSALEVLSSVIERADATRPVVMMIDDLQWSDEPTRAFLSRLGRRSRDQSLSIVCTYRTTAGDLPDDVTAWLAAESRHPRTTSIELAELDADDARNLIAAVLGDDQESQADSLLSQTGGHGLFLTESLRDIMTGGTSRSSIAQIVDSRLHKLEADVQDLVRAGAFLGPEFSVTVAAAVAGLHPADALVAVDSAVRADLLHETSSADRYRFSHQLVPNAIQSSLSKATAAVIHSRCVSALEATGTGEVELAHHVLGAVPLIPIDDAVERGRRAARQATAAKQFDNAIRVFETLLAAPLEPRTRAEVLVDLGRAGNIAGRAGRVAHRFEEAAALARRYGWTDLLVEAALGHQGASPFRILRSSVTLDLLAEADAALGDEPSTGKARVLAKTAVFSLFRLPLATRDELTARALAMANDATPLERLELLEYRAIAFSNPAGVDQLDELDREIKRLRDTHDVYFADAAVPETRLLMRAMGDDFRAEAESDSKRIRSQPIAEWRDLILQSTIAAFEGDLDVAARLCDEAGSIGDQYWGESAFYLHALGRVFIAALDGNWDHAIELIERGIDADATQLLTIHGAWAHLAGGEQRRGRALASTIEPDRLIWFGEHILGGNALVAAAEVALLLDADELASSAEESLVPLSHLMLGVPWACSLAAADPLSRLAARRGDTAACESYSATAREVYSGLEAPALLARLD